MTIWLSACEPSGDRWAARLASALERRSPGIRMIGIAGPEMRRAGVAEAVSLERGSAMGFVDPVRTYRAHRHALRRSIESIRESQPDLVITVDYPGFHLRLLRAARSDGFRTMCYIPPQVWAWRPGRARTVAESADVIVTGFESERGWFTSHAEQERVVWAGHPLADDLPELSDVSGPLALFPGSRRSELVRLAPVMAQAARMTGVDAVFGVHSDEARSWIPKSASGIPVEIGSLRTLLSRARAAIACSGTVTLEAACAGIPMVMCYMTDPFTYLIARSMVRTPWIGLPNIVLEDSVYPELIQRDATALRITDELSRLMSVPRSHWIDTSNRVRELLGPPGTADRIAAVALDRARLTA